MYRELLYVDMKKEVCVIDAFAKKNEKLDNSSFIFLGSERNDCERHRQGPCGHPEDAHHRHGPRQPSH